MNDTTTVWCVKYALTKGIIKLEGEYSNNGNFYGKPRGSLFCNFYHKNDFCETLEAAKERAEELRKRKIASLEKQISNLRTIEIKVVDAPEDN